ncbi:MAG: SPOR domain-containing protein [Acidobacteria bacterium]|nr:SPOR domain-containing protein [Acidobacteriota bacterium]
MKLLKFSLLSALMLVFFMAMTVFVSPNLFYGSNIVQAQSRSFSIQIASAESESEAQTTIADLKTKGVDAYLVKSEVPGKGIRYRVRIGKFASMPIAKTAAGELVAKGAIQEFVVMPYEPAMAPLTARREAKPAPTQSVAKPETKPTAVTEPVKTETSSAEETRIAAKPAEEPKAVETKSVEQAKPVESNAVTTNSAEKPAEPKPIEPKTESVATVTPEPKPARAKEPMEADKEKTEAETAVESKPSPKQDLKLEEKVAEPEESVTSSADAEPKIASPILAEALTEASLSKTNWRMVRRTAETDKNLRAVHFVDSMTGWAAGDAGAVYRTTDGGRTWKPLLSGVSANINFVYFLDWNHGWMIGDSLGKDDDGETVLLSTINGGRTWMIQKIPNLLSVHFSDLQNGWAVGRNATVLRTTNGGNDWKPVEEIRSVIGLPVESSNYNFGFRDVYFLDANHGWLIGNFYGRAQSNIGGLFVTSDGGNTWKRLPLTFQTQHVSGRFTPGLLHSVRFTDENTGSVTGEMRDGENRFFFALHTRDGGKTWEQHRTPSRATHSTQFLDPTNGWMAAFAPREGSAEAVVYDTSLMRTDNGGQSWQNDFTAKGSRIRSIFFLSPYKGWAVGDRGMILRYEEKTKAMN